MQGKLQGRTALVTGATRGIGRGIALELGAAGATVFITGRSHGARRTEDLPGTVESVAAEITALGGKGIGVVCDHEDDAQVGALFARIERDGGLDVLVNNVWGGYEQYDHATFGAPFWQQPLERFDRMFRAGLRAHFVAAQRAAPQLMARKRGLIVNTSAGDAGKRLGSVPYDTVKSAVSRMVFGMAHDLRPHGVAAVGVLPGFTRTERVVQAFGGQPPSTTESTRYAGRAVVALTTDPDNMRWSGRVLRTGEWARIYGFTDVDGRVVPPFEMPQEFTAPVDRF